MNARQSILEKLKKAQHSSSTDSIFRDASLNDSMSESVSRPDFSVMERQNLEQEQRVRQFIQQIESVNGEVHCCKNNTWLATLNRLVQEKSIKTMLWPLSPELKALSENIDANTIFYDRPIEEWQEVLFDRVDAALTTSLGGISETGSLVLWPTPNEPRLMSLVPPIHFVLLNKGNIELSFWHFMKQHGWKETMPTNALLISGPSKTADIEQTLAYGVHGPKELIVLLTENE